MDYKVIIGLGENKQVDSMIIQWSDFSYSKYLYRWQKCSLCIWIYPISYVFVNDGNGHFTNMAKTKNPDITNIEMVTFAIWADVALQIKYLPIQLMEKINQFF
jgi:hypothetical protein